MFALCLVLLSLSVHTQFSQGRMSTSDEEARRKDEKPIATPEIAVRLCKELYGLEVRECI